MKRSKMMFRYVMLAMLLAFVPPSFAQSEEELLGEEPQITITHDGDSTYYEYRVNGVLKEIKVVPAVGEPYYLVPKGESGEMIRAGEPSVLIPQWVIFRW
ncbi:DUF2782 domain-containing protein [Nitrincola sp. MINF-07-Sa-05]|uniref:DUF2782 domain-containing protein n=1 Tax=Nitrincola salilacus TaxID=3400273 RepID=UPI003917E7C7